MPAPPPPVPLWPPSLSPAVGDGDPQVCSCPLKHAAWWRHSAPVDTWGLLARRPSGHQPPRSEGTASAHCVLRAHGNGEARVAGLLFVLCLSRARRALSERRASHRLPLPSAPGRLSHPPPEQVAAQGRWREPTGSGHCRLQRCRAQGGRAWCYWAQSGSLDWTRCPALEPTCSLQAKLSKAVVLDQAGRCPEDVRGPPMCHLLQPSRHASFLARCPHPGDGK